MSIDSLRESNSMKTTTLIVTEKILCNGNKDIVYKDSAGHYHNPYGPAIIHYYSNGKIAFESYYLNNKSHREDGPAIIYYYRDGKIEFEHYYLNDQYHRENGPAHIHYYENGKIQYEEYYLNDKLHREDGPAFISYYEDGKIEHESYYLNGERLSKEDFNNRNNKKDSCQGKIVEIDGRKYKLTPI